VANQFGHSRVPYRPVADVLALAGTAAVLSALLATDRLQPVLPPVPTHALLTLAAAGVGTGAALMGVVSARVLDDRRTAWIAAALVLYSAVVLPLSAAGTAVPGGPYRAPMLIIYLTALVLLVVSVRPPAFLGAWGCWVIAGLGAAGALVAMGAPDSSAVLAVVDDPVLTVAVLVGWTGAAVACAIGGIRERNAPGLRLGLGLVVVAVAQLYRVSTDRPSPDPPFDGLRLLGLTVVLLALVQLVSGGLHRLQSRGWEQEEALAAAVTHLQRAREASAERDHELRNGLAGLAGVAQLLSTEPERSGDHEPLRRAVLKELGRLLALVDGDGPAPALPEGFLVEEVLRERVELRRSAGLEGVAPVELRLTDGLRAAGDPDVLAQVVTNLLANCDRHARGAPITITARRRGAVVEVEVRDEGPGLPPGATDGSLLGRGTRDEAAGGAGLGLHISADLLSRTGGRLTLRNAGSPPGCSAVVHLPYVVEVTIDGPLVADQRPPVVSSRSTDNR
jgi:two-component system OmpR family sensor kinase